MRDSYMRMIRLLLKKFVMNVFLIPNSAQRIPEA